MHLVLYKYSTHLTNGIGPALSRSTQRGQVPKAQGDEELRLVAQELQRRDNVYKSVSEIIKTPTKVLPPLQKIFFNVSPRRR